MLVEVQTSNCALLVVFLFAGYTEAFRLEAEIRPGSDRVLKVLVAQHAAQVLQVV